MTSSPDNPLLEQLDPEEHLLWSGQPRTGVHLRAQDAFLIPFSLLWCGFAVFWEFTAWTATSRAPGPIGFIFPLFGLPFVVIGLFFVFGRFFVDAFARARTFYGVTNERILIISGLLSRQVKSLQLRTLTDVSLTQHRNGSGTVTFGPSQAISGFSPGGSWPGAGRYQPPAFDLVDHAKEAYDIIRQAQRAA